MAEKTVSYNFVKNIRLSLGYTQEELAEALETSGTVVSRWERGLHSPNKSFQRKLIDLLLLKMQNSPLQQEISSVKLPGIYLFNSELVETWLRLSRASSSLESI